MTVSEINYCCYIFKILEIVRLEFTYVLSGVLSGDILSGSVSIKTRTKHGTFTEILLGKKRLERTKYEAQLIMVLFLLLNIDHYFKL